MIDTGLQDRVVLVTGGNHGIGAATAIAFAAQGAAVFINYLRIPVEGQEGEGPDDAAPWQGTPYALNRARSADWVLEAIRGAGGRAEAWEADLRDPATIPQLFDRAEEALGPVEVLVNNAAHCRPDALLPAAGGRALDGLGPPTATITPEGHDQHFAVNSRAVALLMAEYARRHIERRASWGRIVNVSTDGAFCFPGEVSYGASKAALEAYSRSAAMEMASYGITVNIVSPGPIQTGWISPELAEAEVPRIPLGRLGRPEDVAEVIVFLASEQARWLTGQKLYVGGGHTM